MDMPPIPPGSVIIPPERMFDEVTATHKAVTEMRAELKEVAKVLPDHETRIRALERKLWIAAGVSAGAAAGITKALSVVLGGP